MKEQRELVDDTRAFQAGQDTVQVGEARQPAWRLGTPAWKADRHWVDAEAMPVDGSSEAVDMLVQGDSKDYTAQRVEDKPFQVATDIPEVVVAENMRAGGHSPKMG